MTFQRLLDLGEEKLASIAGWLSQGDHVSIIADRIQHEWKLCQEVPRQNLIRQIYTYRTQKVIPKMAMAYQTAQVLGGPGKEATKAIQTFYNQVNVVDELSDLLDLQKQRVYKAILNKESGPATSVVVHEELDLLRRLAMDLLKAQVDCGHIRQSKGIQGQVTTPDGQTTHFSYVENNNPALTQETMGAIIDFIDTELAAVSAHPALTHNGGKSHHSSSG